MLTLAVDDILVAGEIAGLRPPLPASVHRDLDITFVNDFLGRGGASDDFRTQQSIFSMTLGERWILNLDHSILTLIEELPTGRIDQMSVSLGYKWLERETAVRVDRLFIGTGLRGTGKFGGEQIQNGFHRLVGSTIERVPYTQTREIGVTAWFDSQHYRLLRDANGQGLFGSWQLGYQFRAASLLGSTGEWDSTLGLQAVLNKPAANIWLGVRQDFRNGYDDPILRATAEAEDDLALVLGARVGPLVIETVQQFNNKASYGQIRLVSGMHDAPTWSRPGVALEFSTLLPDVQLRLAGRFPSQLLSGDASHWSESVVIGAVYGEPQYGSNTTLFTRSWQIDAGLEFERPFPGDSRWLSYYAGAAAGWRDEKLTGAGDLQGLSSEAVGRFVLAASTGLRFNIYSAADSWHLKVQFGLLARLPVEDAAVNIDGQTLAVLNDTVSFSVGASLEFN